MSFYVSDSLKGRITEDDLVEKETFKKANFQEKLYLEIKHEKPDQSGSQRLCVPVAGIKQEVSRTTIEFGLPDDPDLFKSALSITSSESITLCMSRHSQDESDLNLFSFENAQIELKEIRQSLLGYNYLATIVIHDCIVF